MVYKCAGDSYSKREFDLIEIEIWELYSTWAGADNSWFSPAAPKESQKLSAAGTQSPKTSVRPYRSFYCNFNSITITTV